MGFGRLFQISELCARSETYRHSAYFVKRVLNGVTPADLPDEQPTQQILLSVNLKTAKALSLAVPPFVIVAADAVVE